MTDPEPDAEAAAAAVSRETAATALPPAPAALVERYPDAAAGLTAYAELLATEGVVRGLIGPREVPRVWDRHLLNCVVVEELIPEGSSVADVGSGAGLPGIPLALVRPDLRVTLVESMLRRSTFLEEAVEGLGLTNVTVVRARAEELPRTARFDVVTSRAVAPLDRLAAWCAPILASEGRMLALKGERAEDELAEAAGALRRLRLGSGRIVQVGGDLVSPSTTVVELRGPRRAEPGPKAAKRAARKERGPRPDSRQDRAGRSRGRRS